MFPVHGYGALRNVCGIVELPAWSSVTLTGADRQVFLHNFCTNDVKRLTPGTNCEAFFTNVKGKIIGHGLVTCRDDELVVICLPGQATVLIEHLDRYLIREDVQLCDTTAERAYLLVAGGQPGRDLLSISDPSVAVTIAGVAARYVPWGLLSSSLCVLLEAAPTEMPRSRHSLIEKGAVLCDEAAFHALRIEAGTPLYGVDFDAENLPQEVDRNAQAISFTKGCYLGQETVARIDAMGHVNRQLVGVRFPHSKDDVVPPAGLELSASGTVAGRITSSTYSPQLASPLALAMVRREWTAPGSVLESSAGACEVVSLPLPRPDQ